MKKMNYQNVKGTLDYLPSAEVVRRNVRRTLGILLSNTGVNHWKHLY